MSSAPKLPTFDDLYRELRSLPEGQTGEILNGELVLSPRPAFYHANFEAELLTELRYRFRRRGGGGGPPEGWWIVAGPELHLSTPQGTQVLSPDISGWKRERMPEPPRRTAVDQAPDWVCEILSPSTARRDRREKARIYHQAGVGWYWIVSVDARTIEIYRREGEFWVLLGVWSEEEDARMEPFQEFSLDLRPWWDGLKAPEDEEARAGEG